MRHFLSQSTIMVLNKLSAVIAIIPILSPLVHRCRAWHMAIPVPHRAETCPMDNIRGQIISFLRPLTSSNIASSSFGLSKHAIHERCRLLNFMTWTRADVPWSSGWLASLLSQESYSKKSASPEASARGILGVFGRGSLPSRALQRATCLFLLYPPKTHISSQHALLNRLPGCSSPCSERCRMAF